MNNNLRKLKFEILKGRYLNNVITPLSEEEKWSGHYDAVAKISLSRNIFKYLEIGCQVGQLVALSAIFNPDAYIFAVDLPGGPYGGMWDSERYLITNLERFASKRYKYFLGNSFSSAARTFIKNNAKYDLAVIDGDHSYMGCKQDFENVLPFMQKNGIIIFDDLINSGPRHELNILFDNILKLNPHLESEKVLEGGGYGILYLNNKKPFLYLKDKYPWIDEPQQDILCHSSDKNNKKLFVWMG